jgi:hypothetical protein
LLWLGLCFSRSWRAAQTSREPVCRRTPAVTAETVCCQRARRTDSEDRETRLGREALPATARPSALRRARERVAGKQCRATGSQTPQAR